MNNFFSKNLDKWLALLVVSPLLLFMAQMIVQSTFVSGGMDSFEHFIIAKYSWKHPSLFLDNWGKPLYTLFNSTLAQLGLKAMAWGNFFYWILASILSYLTAKNLNLKIPIAAFVFTLCTPLFIFNIVSSLTESFSAVLTILCVYFFSKNKIYSGALIAGFLPYVRSESYFLVLVIFFSLLIGQKNVKAIFLLAIGSLFFNFLGFIIEGEPFWIYTSNPYLKVLEQPQMNFCGSGSFLTYFMATKTLYGLVLFFLIIIGILFSIIPIKNSEMSNDNKSAIRLIFGLVGIFYLAHSFIWWKGLMGSCGYTRVFVQILPLMAILSLYGIEKIFHLLKHFKIKNTYTIYKIILLFISIYLVVENYNYGKSKLPFKTYGEFVELDRVIEWYKNSKINPPRTSFFSPYLNVKLNRDPYIEEKHIKLYSFNPQNTATGTLVIWDSHFGPNEGRMPLEILENDSTYQLIKEFYPEKPFKTMNDRNYYIKVFQKTAQNSKK